MGNSVADFGKDLTGFRDRYSRTVEFTDISTMFITGQTPNNTQYSSGSAQRCVDFNDPKYYAKMRLRKKYGHLRDQDFGHSFAKESVSVSMPSIVRTKTHLAGNFYQNFQGVCFPTVQYGNVMNQLSRGGFPSIPAALGADRTQLWTLGSTAIRKSLPDVPSFSLYRMIGELRAGLPKVPLATLAKEKKLRNVGGEYLNYQFGIMPTISDLQKFMEVLLNPKLRAAVKSQLGKEYRVRKTIDKGSVSTKRALTSTEMQTLSPSYSSVPTGYEIVQQDYRIWSSCSFGYYQLTQIDQLLDDLDQQLGGMGLVPNAIDLWNLVPWSWLVDWFTNFNHVITNFSYLGRDGLYLQRGYIMAHYSESVTTHQERVFMGTPISTTGVIKSERKYRVKASPFGFGYIWKDFSPFQLSILGSLGISRMRF